MLAPAMNGLLGSTFYEVPQRLVTTNRERQEVDDPRCPQLRRDAHPHQGSEHEAIVGDPTF